MRARKTMIGGESAALGVAPDRTVYDGYANGYLTAVLPQYASSITYHPNGMMQSVVHANGVTDQQGLDPNAMARPQQIWTSGAKVNGAPGGDWSTNPYGYDGSGNVKTMGGDTFVYDQVSRLTSASVTGYGSESYAWDAYGNLTTYGGRSLATDATTNRLTSAGYTAPGNLASWGGYSFTYTSLNQLASVSGGMLNRRLAYTADGERIVVRDGGSTMVTVRDLGGHVVSELLFNGASWSWSKDYVYRDGSLLASVSATDGVRHYTLDHLGSPRLVTNRCGERIKFFVTNPFGLDATTSQDPERMRFTVHERDLGSLSASLDDIDTMHARSYMPYLARFTSADLLRGDPHSPQSFNLFAYAKGNSINYIDPLGLQALNQLPDEDDPCNNPEKPNPDCVPRPIAELILCRWFGLCNGGGSGTGQSTVTQVICSALPSGRTIGVSASFGGIGPSGGGGELVINYNSGQVSAFGFGSAGAGWNGALQATGYTGFVWGLNDSNSNYSGGFTGGNLGFNLGEFGGGGFAAFSSGGLGGLATSSGLGALRPSGTVMVAGVSASWAAIPSVTFGGTATNYTSPIQLGESWGVNAVDRLLYLTRQGVCK